MVDVSRICDGYHGKVNGIKIIDYINEREFQFIYEFFEEHSRVLDAQTIMLMLWFNQMDLDEDSAIYEDGHHMFINYAFKNPSFNRFRY